MAREDSYDCGITTAIPPEGLVLLRYWDSGLDSHHTRNPVWLRIPVHPVVARAVPPWDLSFSHREVPFWERQRTASPPRSLLLLCRSIRPADLPRRSGTSRNQWSCLPEKRRYRCCAASDHSRRFNAASRVFPFALS